MILGILSSFILSLAFASEPMTKAEVLQQTQLTEKTLSMMVQKDLESFLFYDDDGISCGLEEFFIEGYNLLKKDETGMTSFEVVTEVTGPVNYCGGYSRYACYTKFNKKNSVWEVAYTECDEPGLYDE